MKHYQLALKLLGVVSIVCLSGTLLLSQSESNVPLYFYAKVVDQNNMPITGASVNLSAVVDRFERNDTEEKKYFLSTDQNGRFSLIGAFGSGVHISSIEKPGYVLSKKAKLDYTYTLSSDVYHPDSNRPVVFRMWKESGKEPLVGSSWRGKVACDGTTNRFDLLTGHPNGDGSLEIACTRTPLNYEFTNREPYNYIFELAIVGGGVQTAQQEFTYRAPSSGYSSHLTIERKSGESKWKAGVREEFYIKTAKGDYGCISVEWDAGHRPAPTILEWNCLINPSGSPNLER